VIRTLYAISRTSLDRFPVSFRPECDRTLFNWKGEDCSYLDMLISLDRAGYDLVDRDKLLKILDQKGWKR
jgi:hypothetical protein